MKIETVPGYNYFHSRSLAEDYLEDLKNLAKENDLEYSFQSFPKADRESPNGRHLAFEFMAYDNAKNPKRFFFTQIYLPV